MEAPKLNPLALEVPCATCGKLIPRTATKCAHCGDFAGQYAQVANPSVSRKEMSFLLMLGVFFMPYIFSWFTLREGYSQKARFWSLGWLTFFCIRIAVEIAIKR